VKAGAQVLELDMQLTADDVVVVCHEPDITPALCRYTSGKPLAEPIPLRSLKASELVQFECGMNPHPRFPRQKKMPGAAIPTLDAFLQWKAKHAPSLEMNIETKMTARDPKWIADPAHFASLVVTLLKKHGVVSKAILQSFDFRTLSAAKKLEPALRLSCLFEHAEDFCEKTRREGAQFASPEKALVTADRVKACRALGIQVVPWTANLPEEWHKLLESGVDAIITDYPRDLVAYLTALRLGSPAP
jgi:glycerophosphoryl diester phosphodiesterase